VLVLYVHILCVFLLGCFCTLVKRMNIEDIEGEEMHVMLFLANVRYLYLQSFSTRLFAMLY